MVIGSLRLQVGKNVAIPIHEKEQGWSSRPIISLLECHWRQE